MRKIRPNSGKKHVVIALPLLSEDEIELVQGVRRGLSLLGDDYVVIVLSGGYESSLRKLADLGELAGTIGEFMSPIWLESLIGKGIPVVQLGRSAGGSVPSISSDLNAMAEEAADNLIENGVRSLAYLGPSGPSGSAQLGESFAKSSQHRGYKLAVSSEFSGSILKEFLHSLPRPIGLLCATDRLARLAILLAKDSGLQIPQDLAVIGVGNSRMESLHAGIPLSSFELPLEEIGIKAGSMMINLIKGNSVTPLSHSISATLHERDSSIRSSSGLTRALAHLRSNPGSNMSAGELARFAGMSRRSFEIAAQREFGKSPGTLLQEMRRDRAEKFLRETQQDIAEIGKACGYQEASVFSTAFKRWTGQSPRDYRKQHTSQP